MESTLRGEIDTCLDVIRQHLMCVGDVTPYLMYKEGEQAAVADYDSPHRCVKMNGDSPRDARVVDWAEEHFAFAKGMNAPAFGSRS